MDLLFLLQFACLIFMFINAIILGVTHIHVKWVNKRYEQSRWMILVAIIGLAMQYIVQMYYGFRATNDDVGAVVNILVYTPCFTLIAMGIYNIEAKHANRKRMNLISGSIYAAILIAFGIGHYNNGNMHIGAWLYVMLTLYMCNVVYYIYIIVKEIRKRKKILETMTATDMLPYVRYAHTSIFLLCLTAVIIPFAILSTTLLYIVGPLGLIFTLFFVLNFVTLGYNYVPYEEMLDKEKEEDTDMESNKNTLSQKQQTIIREGLDKWCAEFGYKDSTVNLLTLSCSLNVTKSELSRYFTLCLHSTFRSWLAEIRFKAAKKMMIDNPDFNNDIISAECGFSSRSYLYRIFKEKEGCSPTAWRERKNKKTLF